jgi:hypothetical protein
MRLLFVLGFAVACSSNVETSQGNPFVMSGVGGDVSAAGVATAAGGKESTTVGGGTVAEAGATAGVAGFMVVGGTSNAGAVGLAGSGGDTDVETSAGQGGQATEAAAAGAGASSVGESGAGGAAGDAANSSAGAGGQPDECVCSSGPCCDGCGYRPKSHFCGETMRDAYCSDETRITRDYWNLFCNGDSTECTRWAVHTKYVDSECPGSGECVDGNPSFCVN